MFFRIEFATALSIAISAVVALVYCLWLVYTRNRKECDIYEGLIKSQCPYCTGMVFVPEGKAMFQCPHCRSLLSPEERHAETS